MHVDEETYIISLNNMIDDDEAFKAGMDGLTSSKYDSQWTNYKLIKNRQTVNPHCNAWLSKNVDKR